MRQSFEIPGWFASADELFNMTSSERAAVESENVDFVVRCARMASLLKVRGAVRVSVRWVEPHRGRDLADVSYAKRYVVDGLVKAGIIGNKTSREIVALSDEFGYDRMRPRIIVEINEA